jgi:hypothetical protein
VKIIEYFAESNDGRQATSLYINDELIYSVVDGEPEDNCLARNFSFSLRKPLTMVYEAGKLGEECTFEEKVLSWEDFWSM